VSRGQKATPTAYEVNKWPLKNETREKTAEFLILNSLFDSNAILRTLCGICATLLSKIITLVNPRQSSHTAGTSST
jgi:hypothetical protein